MSIGKVYLVGAGPGDPDLITRKGIAVAGRGPMSSYTTVLIPPELLLDEARPDAELIDAGKAAGEAALVASSRSTSVIARSRLEGQHRSFA